MYPTYMASQSNYPSTDEIVMSPITARATVRVPGQEGVTIIAAFQLSYYYAFWFVFKAKSARTARRHWKFVRREVVVLGMPRGKTKLEDLIARVTGTAQGAKITKRYPKGKRNFESHLQRVANPTKVSMAQTDVQPWQAKKVNRINGWGRGRL